MENEIEYTPVNDGFHECRIAFAKRADKHFGKEITGHIVYEMRLVPTDCPEVEHPASYKAEFPVLVIPGFDWDLRDVWRKATAEDTRSVLDYAKKCVPAWAAYCKTLSDDEDALAWSWFVDKSYTDAVTINARLTYKGTYTGSDGLEHPDCKAKIYPPLGKMAVVADDEKAQIAKALKSAGVKLFGKTSAPATPKPKSVDELHEEAVEGYRRNCTDDPEMAKFYERAAAAINREVITWESWTANEWTKIVNLFDMPF